MNDQNLTFWGHLDVLRGCLIKIILGVTLGSVVAFCLKDEVFNLVLAPSHDEFFVYRWMGAESFSITLVNTGLTEQMLSHIKVAVTVGTLAVSPYIIYVLFGFISPALYENERRYSARLTLAAYLMFMVGVVVNYVLIFPLSFRFLGTYQVSEEVTNMLTISSYVDTFMMMTLIFGVVFEIPVLSWLLGRMGLIKAEWMRRYRRHAFVVILIVAAFITPTPDALTLFIVSLPIWLLYELSIFLVK